MGIVDKKRHQDLEKTARERRKYEPLLVRATRHFTNSHIILSSAILQQTINMRMTRSTSRHQPSQPPPQPVTVSISTPSPDAMLNLFLFLWNTGIDLFHCCWEIFVDLLTCLDLLCLPATMDSATLTSLSIALLFVDRIFLTILQWEEQVVEQMKLQQPQPQHQQSPQYDETIQTFIPVVMPSPTSSSSSSFLAEEHCTSNANDDRSVPESSMDGDILTTILIGLFGVLLLLLSSHLLVTTTPVTPEAMERPSVMERPSMFHLRDDNSTTNDNWASAFQQPQQQYHPNGLSYTDGFPPLAFPMDDETMTVLCILIGMFCMEGIWLLSSSIFWYDFFTASSCGAMSMVVGGTETVVATTVTVSKSFSIEHAMRHVSPNLILLWVTSLFGSRWLKRSLNRRLGS
jgi:hypothetical protein